jgi:hypothetical protein
MAEPKPKNIARFEELMYASLVLAWLVTLLGLDRLHTLLGVGWVLGATAVELLTYVWLTWLVARRRRSWPRWYLLVSFVLHIPLLFMEIGKLWDESVLSGILVLVRYLLHGLALFLLFSGDTDGWFVQPIPRPVAAPKSAAYRSLTSLFLVLLTMATILSVLGIPALGVVAFRSCVPNCSILVALAIIGVPLTLGAGTVLGWARRSKVSFRTFMLLTLGPVGIDLAFYAIGQAITASLRI